MNRPLRLTSAPKRPSRPRAVVKKVRGTNPSPKQTPVLEVPGALAKALEKPKHPTISLYVLEKLKTLMAMRRKKGERIHPYVAANHPPSVFPKGQMKIAQDEALNESLQWAQNAWSIWDEGLTFLGYPYLSEITQRPEYRRPSEIIATEMTREWIEFQSTNTDDDGTVKENKHEKIKKIEDEMDRLKVRDAFKECAEYDGFFGRVHLYLDTGDTDNRPELKTPIGNGRNDISKSKVGLKKPLQRVVVIEPIWTYPAYYNAVDPMKPDWYNPEIWYVQAKETHVSRLLTFVGRPVPDLLKPTYSFGGLSLSQMMKPYVDNWIRTRQSVSDLIYNFSVMVLSTDMSTLLQDQGQQLLQRLDFFNALRSNQGAMMVNKDTEELQNVAVPLGSLDHLLAQSQEQMAAPCGIPLVKLFGITPSGLNATSEGEIQVFYDWIAAFQETLFRVNLTKVIDFIQLSLFGEVDEDITFSFRPLKQLNDKERADMRKVDADTDVVLIGASVISPKEARQRVASDPESPYASLDVEDVPIPDDDGDEEDMDELDKDDAETDKGKNDFKEDE